jgi:bleomycin hydrolase
VDHRGEMNFGEGSETNALAVEMKAHGAVPEDAYLGRNPNLPFYDHTKMYEELDNYLKSVKERNEWNKETVVNTTKSILDHYMGTPPETVTINGKKMTPQDYLSKYLKLNMDDYVNFMSLMQSPYYQTAEYTVGDNWWHSNNYNNVPLGDFTHAIKEAIDGGYTLSIGGDVSEAGFDGQNNVAFVPTFDIPSEYINDEARQMRFLNGSTTDDHAMHLVGYAEKDGKTWFLIKDSGAGSRSCGEGCKSFGYYYMSEDYVKLKMMTITVNKNAVKDILSKMKKA